MPQFSPAALTTVETLWQAKDVNGDKSYHPANEVISQALSIFLSAALPMHTTTCGGGLDGAGFSFSIQPLRLYCLPYPAEKPEEKVFCHRTFHDEPFWQRGASIFSGAEWSSFPTK